jgi:hypothetical protein
MNDWLIDIELTVMYVAIFAAVAFSVWSVIRSLRLRDKSQSIVNNIPVTKIAYGCAALLVVCLLLTFLVGSSDPMTVNGQSYTNKFWLKATDMFIFTSLILAIVAAIAVLFGMSGLNRKSHYMHERGDHVQEEKA